MSSQSSGQYDLKDQVYVDTGMKFHGQRVMIEGDLKPGQRKRMVQVFFDKCVPDFVKKQIQES